MEDEERSQNEEAQNERKNASRFTRDASRKIAAALLSGVLFFCSFPPLECASLAWVALVPVIYLCFQSEPGKSFLYGLLAGVVFWLASIFWLMRVSFIGWIFVSLYCSLYGAFFALIVSWWHWNLKKVGPHSLCGRKDGGTGCPALPGNNFRLWRPNLMFLFGVPAVWVGLEYARSHFLTGFPWNLLGVSQYSCGPIIQCAEWGGVYLVSFLIVMANTAVVMLIFAFQEGFARRAWPTGITLFVCLLLIDLAFGYGKWRQSRSEALETIRAAAVQPNVPQPYKWSEDWADDICRRLKKTAAEICRAAAPDLIVWPETALTDFMRSSGPSRDLVNEILRGGVPLLAGSMDYETLPGKTNYFNSSFLFLPGRDEPQVYAKRHLVLFGEYVPFARLFPFLRSIAGVEEDFTPGTENVVFQLKGGGQKFSVLICFEDTLPYLARECVRAGARLLINQTNDAWFDPSWASRQHMAHCVFRCIENRVACLRATNTGLTCLIDRFGRIRSALLPLGREPREAEVLRAETPFSPEEMPLTFYTRHGDLFALACAAFSLPLFLGALLSFCGKGKSFCRMTK